MDQPNNSNKAEKFVLIDNGLLGHLCRKNNEKSVNIFFNSLHRLGILGNFRTKYITTPFILLEAIGVKVPSIPKFKMNEKVLDTKSIEDTKNDLFNYALSQFSNQPELNPTELRKRAKEQLNHCSEIGKQLFHNSIGHKVQNYGFERLIYKNLAFDYMYKFEYPVNSQHLFHASFATDVHRTLSHGWEISMFRAARNSWKHLYPMIVKESVFTGQNLVQIHDHVRLDNKADFLDTELIHYAVMGKLVDDILQSVNCFTCDDDEQIRHRIGLYKSFLKPVWDIFEKLSDDEKKRLPFKQFFPADGYVFVCDNSGSVQSAIDVNSIDSIDDFKTFDPS